MAEIDDENIVNEDNQYSRVDNTTTEPPFEVDQFGNPITTVQEVTVTQESQLSPYMRTYRDNVQSNAKKAMLNQDFNYLGGFFDEEYENALRNVDRNIQGLNISEQDKANIYKDQDKLETYVEVYKAWKDSGGTGEFVLFNPDLKEDNLSETVKGRLAFKESLKKTKIGPPPSLTMSGKPASKQPLGDNNRYNISSPNLLADARITTEEKEKQREIKFKELEARALVEKKAKDQALQIWKNGLTTTEFENYNKISNIGLNLMSDYEENSVLELNKRFAGSGIYFEETGFGDQIKVRSSIDNNFSAINEEIFQLYPKRYGGFQNAELLYDEQGAKKELERLQEFIRDSFLNKSEKDFLNKEGLTMENMVKLKADNPRKYGEKFLTNDEVTSWLDRQSLDIAATTKWVNKSTEDINKTIKQYEGKEMPVEVRQELNTYISRVSKEKDRLTNQQVNLDITYQNAKTSAGYYYAINEEKGNIAGIIGRGFVKGITNLAKLEGDIVADVIPYIFGDDATSSLQRAQMERAGMSETEINNTLTRDLKKLVDEKALESLQNIASFGTTKEYAQSEKRNTIEKVAGFLSESIGTATSAGGNPTLSKLAFFAQSYNAMSDQMTSSEFDKLNIFEKKLMSVPYGIAIGYLERLGFKATTGGSKLLDNLVTSSISSAFLELPKDASLELMKSAINKSIVAQMTKSGLSIVGGSFIEGSVEGTQSLTEVAAKQLFNSLEGHDYFKDVPDLTTKDGMAKALVMASEDFYYGMLGGLVMSSGTEAYSAIKDGYSNKKLDANFEILYNSVTDPKLIKLVKSEIKANLTSGKINRYEAESQLNAIEKSYSIFKSMPDKMSTKERREAFNLIREKQIIEKEIEGKDPSLVDAQKKRVSEINNELKTISNNAAKETTNKQQAVTAEGGVSEYQGASEGQQEVGQVEGGQREATVNETDSRNSTIPSQVQEEVTTYRAEEQAELLKVIPKIENYKVNGEVDKTLMPKTVLDKYNKVYNKYDKLISPLLETTAPQRVVQEEVANKTTDENYDISQEVNNNIAKENPDASVLLTPKGNDLSLNAVYVGKEKRGKGIGTKVLETVKSEANRTGKKIVLDATNELDSETDLERLSIFYEKNGFKKVSENKFEYNPQETTAKTETKKTEYKQNLVTTENLREVVSRQDTPLKQGVAKSANMVMRALPGVKVYLHNNQSEMHQALADSTSMTLDKVSSEVGNSAGSQVKGEIHVNMDTAKSTTILHEAFHEAILRSGKSIKTITDFANGLKNIISDKDVKAKLDEFISMYEESDKSEEFMSELGAIMAESETELTTTKFQKFLNLINRIARSLGLPVIIKSSATAQEAVDFINSMARSLRTGEEIVVSDAINVDTNELSIKQQKIGDFDVSYFEDDNEFKKLVKEGLVENNYDINKISGEVVAVHQPDNMFVGALKNLDKLIFNGNGGVFYTSITGNVWASGAESSAKSLANLINKSLKESTDGVGRLVLVRGTDSKMISSTEGVKASMSIIELLVDKGLINRSEFRSSLIRAGKKFNIDFSGKDSSAAIHKDIKEKFMDVKNSTFQKRGDFFDEVINDLAKTSKSATDNKVEIRKVLGSKRDISFSKDGIRDSIGYILTERLLQDLPNSHAYAIIEVTDPVTYEERKGHDSYPWVLKSKSKPKLKLLSNRGHAVKDGVFEMIDGSVVTQGKLGLAQRGMGIAKISEQQSKIKQQKTSGVGYRSGDLTNKAETKGKFEGGNRSTGHFGTGFYFFGTKKKADEYSNRETSSIDLNGYNLANGTIELHNLLKDVNKYAIGTQKENDYLKYSIENIIKYFNKLNGLKDISDQNNKIKSIVDKINNSTIDSPSTIVMKSLGFDGVDSRGTDLDNAQYGSVIYSLKTAEEGTPSKIKQQKTAPNGKPSKLDDVQWEQVRTPAFKKWFGDWENDPKNASKVVDENGEPMPVYHGTSSENKSDIEKSGFDSYKGRNGLVGFSFMSDIKLVEPYNKGAIIDVFLNLRNPINYDANFKIRSEILKGLGKTFNTMTTSDWIKYTEYISKEFINQATKLGYDGVFQSNQSEINVFKNTNIKIADGTNTTFDATQPSIKLQKTTQETRMDKESEDVFKESLDLGTTWATATQNALDYIQKSKWYQDATDVEREQKVRDFKESKKQKLKKAPSVAKILGTPKPKMVTVNEAAAFKDQIRLEAKAARDAKGDLNFKRKSLSDAIKGIVKLGKLKVQQANTIITRVSKVNLDSSVQVERLIEYASRVFERANYQDRLNEAFSYKRAIRKLLKTDNQAPVVGMANEFTKLDPSLVENIEEYIDIAEKVKKAVAPSRAKPFILDKENYFDIDPAKGFDMALKQATNIEAVSKFVKDELEKQEQQLKDELLATNNDLFESGVLSTDMTAKQMQEIVDAIKKDPAYKIDSKENEKYMMAYLLKRFESLAGTVEDIIKTNQNPVTGERVAIDQKDVAIMSDLLKVDLSEMGVRDALFIVEAMDNFITNGITSKLEGALSAYKGQMGLKKEIRSGKVARPLKLYLSKELGRGLANEVTPLPLMIERMFTGVTSGISVMDSMGLSILINGVNKANYLHNKIIDEYYNKFIRKSRTFHTPENVYERGMFAFLKRNVAGSLEEMKSETNRRVKMITQSITTLKNKGNELQKAMAKIYQKVFDKLGVNTGDIDVIESRVSKENKDAVYWWMKEWSKHYKDLADVSLSVYNYDLGSDINYSSPDKYKLIKTEEFDKKLIERNSSFLISMDNYTDKEKTGVLMQSKRPNAMEEDRYLSFDFDTNNSNSLKGALVDVNTAAAIRQVDGFLNSKLLDKLIPSTEDRDALVIRVNRYIRRAKGKVFVPKDLYKYADDALNFAARLGIGKALGGVLQSVKQTIPIAISTAIMTGKFNIPSVSFNEWLNKTGMGTANRGLDSLSAIESVDRRLDAKATGFKKPLKWVQKTQQQYLKWFLSKPDVMIARTAFQSYYLQYMGKTSIDWDNHTPNQDALNYAEAMVGRQQNINDPMLGGEFLTAEDSMKRMSKKVLFPFASFGLNQKARLNSDLINIGAKTTSFEDRKIALKSLTATIAEMVAYRAIMVGISYELLNVSKDIINYFVGDDEDDDEDKEREKKWLLSSTKYPIKSMINDLVAPLPLLDKYVTMGADYILSLNTGYTEAELDELVKNENEIRGLKGLDPLEGRQLKKFREEEKKESLYQLGGEYENSLFGMGSIFYDAASKFIDEYQLAMTGEFKDEYRGNITTKKIRPVEQELIKNSLIFSALFMLEILPKEADQVTTKVVKMIKRNAMSEPQYEKYESFKKEYKREPGYLEMALIRSDKKQDYIENELNFIKDEGGLSLVQAKEYVKIFNLINEVTPDDLSKIKEGQTADQIIKSLKKEYKERISEVETETKEDEGEVFKPIKKEAVVEEVFKPNEKEVVVEEVFKPIETNEETEEVFQPIEPPSL